MHLPYLATILIWTISLISIFLMLVRPRGIAEAYWACGGALVLIVGRLISLSAAGQAVRAGIDVYLFLTGMMILAELAREEGVFEWVADVAAHHANGSQSRLFLLIYITGTIVTALLSNDATAVVLTPAVLAVVRRANVEPKPYLLACALIANAASFVFPISNPANLVVFDQHMPPLMQWLRIFILPSVVSVVVTFLCLRLVTRNELRGQVAENLKKVTLSTEGKLALVGLLIAAAALITASALGLPLGAPTCGAAVFAMVVVMWRDRKVPLRVIRGVSWAVLPLVAGLFVIVEALQSAGMLRFALSGLAALTQTSQRIAGISAGFAVAVLSNVMNNLPVGLISGVALQHSHQLGPVSDAVLIGVDLGPNLSVTGSLATILWLIALRREKVEITAWEFLKIGAIAMPLALLPSLLVLTN
jgi:arsenical pump membrane protein